MTIAKEIPNYKSDLVRVQEVRWDGGGTEPAGEYIFFYGKGNDNHELGTDFIAHKRIISVDAPTDDKINDVKDNYEELERVFNEFPKYYMKMLLGDLNVKVGRSNQRFGIGIYTKLMFIMELE
jgi:hypothetical protein